MHYLCVPTLEMYPVLKRTIEIPREDGIPPDHRQECPESEKGTNPEELVAAAHAACFSMALSSSMSKEGLNPESIDTTATVTFENVNGAWTVTSSHLQTAVKSPNASPAAFQKAAEGAKQSCPISRLLNTTITMDAKLA